MVARAEGEGAPGAVDAHEKAMMFDLAPAADLTARTFRAREGQRGQEQTFVAERPSRAFDETPFVAFRAAVPSVHWNGTLTPTAAGLKTQTNPVRASVVLHTDSAGRARDARAVLLARTYEGGATVEDNARFAILTARLRKLSPRFTIDDIEKLDTMVGELEQVSANLDEIRSTFGLK